MKFSCSMTDFSSVIQTSARAVSPKTSIPALEGILITAKTDLICCGYDLKTGITCSCDADVIESGCIVINAKLITEIARKLPAGTVFFETDREGNVSITCGPAEYTLSSIPGEDFPEMPMIDGDKTITIKSEALRKLINGTMFSVSVLDTKPIFTGVLFDISEGLCTAVSTDNYRLSVCRQPVAFLDPVKFVVPAATLREIVRILPEGDESVEIQISEKHIIVKAGNTVIFSGLLEGQFLRYENTISAPQKNILTVKVAELAESVDRVTPVVNEKLKNPLHMKFDDGDITISYISSTAKAKDLCYYEGNCEPLEIGISNKFLSDVLRAIPDETCEICLSSKGAPMTIRQAKGTDYIYVIALMKI